MPRIVFPHLLLQRPKNEALMLSFAPAMALEMHERDQPGLRLHERVRQALENGEALNFGKFLIYSVKGQPDMAQVEFDEARDCVDLASCLGLSGSAVIP